MCPTPSPVAGEPLLRALVVDDEAPARERLKRLLEELGEVAVIGEAGTGSEALALCAELAPDVVLLDVRMPGMDGIEAAHHLNALREPPAVVFTTAFDEYALEAFESQAIGYLLKPVRREKLARALHRAARIAAPQIARLRDEAGLEHRRTQVCARLGEQLRLIPVADIRCFQADQKYVSVHHGQGTDLIDESLRELAEEFAADFVRIHRSTLVALRHVESVERTEDGGWQVRVAGLAAPLPLSRRHASEALRQFRGVQDA
jgi:two-component system response regulator AlgR